MSSALERFRALERASLISDAERARNARFQALNRDWAAEGGGSTRLTPGQQAALTNTRAANRAPGGVFNPEGTTPPPPPPPPPGADSTAGVSTGTFQYSPVLPPLSPEAQRAFAERRRRATAQAEQAAQNVARQRQQAEAAAVQGRRQIAREQGEQSRAGMAELAGRGVARSPMFVNPFQRQVARQAQQRVGELEMGLGQTLENLRLALQEAEAARERELNRIEFDILAARSNVPQLLGVG